MAKGSSSSKKTMLPSAGEGGKRGRGGEEEEQAPARGGGGGGGRGGGKESKDNLRFEDPYEDEFEEESLDEMEDVVELDSDEEDEMDVEALKAARAGHDDEDDMDTEDAATRTAPAVYLPGMDAEGDELVYDPSAYLMYHGLTPEWPCLSFDIVRDPLGGGRTRYPITMYAVCGTQADARDKNKLTLMKLSQMHRTYKKPKHTNDDSDEEDDSDSDDDEEDEEEGAGQSVDPLLEQCSIDHRGGVNRLRAMPQQSSMVATWSDTAHVHLWDIASLIRAVDSPSTATNDAVVRSPLLSYAGHKDEGWAMDWSSVSRGRLATGDNRGEIHVWEGGEAGQWAMPDSQSHYRGHASSVEDLQWSPTEASVFISASSDKTLKVWDVRNKQGCMLSVPAHDTDVNVCSWNRNVAYLAVTGADDGSFKVWDLRQFSPSKKESSPIAHFTWHRAAITSIAWHPQDESILACASEDDTVSIWDLSVEEDEGEAKKPSAIPLTHLPPQLLFVHQGQQEIKEVLFHPQVPGLLMTTAADGFNVFQPAIGL